MFSFLTLCVADKTARDRAAGGQNLMPDGARSGFLDLQEVQLDRRFAAKERDQHAHLRFFHIDIADGADEIIERPVDDPDLLASSERDRKSTRLNSSHVKSSYAVFC